MRTFIVKKLMDLDFIPLNTFKHKRFNNIKCIACEESDFNICERNFITNIEDQYRLYSDMWSCRKHIIFNKDLKMVSYDLNCGCINCSQKNITMNIECLNCINYGITYKVMLNKHNTKIIDFIKSHESYYADSFAIDFNFESGTADINYNNKIQSYSLSSLNYNGDTIKCVKQIMLWI